MARTPQAVLVTDPTHGRLALTVAEAAKAVGMSRSRFYTELAAGRVLARKCGTRTLIPIDSLKAWLDALPAGGPPTSA